MKTRVSRNLKAARNAAGLTQAEASSVTDIPLGTIRRWEQGVNEPDMGSIILLAEMYGVTTDTLLGSRYADVIGGKMTPDFIDVPLCGSIAAGSPIEMEAVDNEYPIPYMLSQKYGPDIFLLKVIGNSMNNVLPNGSYALIDPGDKDPIDGGAYAVCVNGYDATIKRVRRLANGFELVPDSSDPTYRACLYDYNEPGTEQVTIIGRVVWYCVPIDFTI